MNRWPGKYVIGLTGNICAGKTVVCAVLEDLGAFHVDADLVAHQMLIYGKPEFARVVMEFGDEILGEDGQIDRGLLGQIVFSDLAALATLEGILHPAVGREIGCIISSSNCNIVVLEAIKLLESGLDADCHEIWVVTANPDKRRRRLVARDGLSDEDALRRLEIQLPQKEKIKRADVVIDNNGNLSQVRVQVRRAWGKIGRPLRTEV